MQTIKLTILAKDIKSTDYFHSSDCAITRALQRSGYHGWHDGGSTIRNEDNDIIVNSSNNDYQRMSLDVIAMYRKSGNIGDFDGNTLEIIDREYTINF